MSAAFAAIEIPSIEDTRTKAENCLYMVDFPNARNYSPQARRELRPTGTCKIKIRRCINATILKLIHKQREKYAGFVAAMAVRFGYPRPAGRPNLPRIFAHAVIGATLSVDCRRLYAVATRPGETTLGDANSVAQGAPRPPLRSTVEKSRRSDRPSGKASHQRSNRCGRDIAPAQ